MSSVYKTRYGFDWPVAMPDELIGLTIGKKWREYADAGFEFRDPWVPMLDAMKSLYPEEYFKVSEWTEQHVHDWVMEQMLLTWGCASSGKALLPDEPVYTPSGVTTIGQLNEGDLVISATGKPARVRRVFDHVDHRLFRVRFSDGTETVCDEGHLWTVRYWTRVRWDGSRPNRKAVYGYKTSTVPVTRLAGWSNIKRRRVSVPLTKPVEFLKKTLPIDPYVLGCLLGDGTITGNVMLTVSQDDRELLDEFSRRLSLTHAGYVLRQYGFTWNIVKADGSKSANLVKRTLTELGLYGRTSHDKFIPDLYKFGSLDDRIDLLAGLLDTDGTVSKQGQISFCTVSARLRDDVRFLLESVGASVTVSARHPVFSSGGVRRHGSVAYELDVHGLDHGVALRLFKLSRKRSRLHARRHDGYKSVVSVEAVENRSDYPRETRCITLSERDVDGNAVNGLFPVGHFTVTHNSNDTGALIVLDWVTDPYDTISMVGSTTKDALRIRTWESIERYFGVLKSNARFAVPGKITQTGYAILNDRGAEEDNPLAQGGKAGIHGVALNDGGKLQGAHLPYVRLVIDELATIYNHQDILTTIENLQIAKDFRFVGLANPESWSNPSCQYAIPEKGIDSVNVDTGCWRSTFGCFVRHHDGLKSPCIRHPELSPEFPFLTQSRHVESSLKRCQGNPDAPHFWKMVRGFPLPAGNSGQVVLDEAIAVRNHVSDPSDGTVSGYVATVAGIDPAWTEGGDSACYARCVVRLDWTGKPYLDFTNGMRKLSLNASEFKSHPAVEQLRNQVIGIMREPYAATFRMTAVDSSGNQSLADDLIIYAGATDILSVNFATRASEEPIRSLDTKPVKDTVYDRGTEAWCVLAEFCRAGQVRGLPMTVVEALTSRRYAANMVKDATGQKVPAGVKHPLRLEDKTEFKKRYHGRSPDEADACALAALAAKERLGLLPFGYVSRKPGPSPLVPAEPVRTPQAPADDYSFDGSDTDDLYDPPV